MITSTYIYINFQVRRAPQVKGCGASCRSSDSKVGTAKIKCVRTAEIRFEKSERSRSAPHLCNLRRPPHMKTIIHIYIYIYENFQVRTS